MGAPNSTVDQNLLPVQAYFDVYGNFQTFIGQGKPFYATSNPIQSGLTITNSTLDSSPIGSTFPSTAVFTDMKTTTGQISTQPSSANDIVNLLALQSYAAGISWKQPCACATLAPITLLGLQTIDGYTTLVGDRVLVKNQATASQNGIYIASATAWIRAFDANTWNELISAISFIEYGTQAGGAWFCTAQPGGTIDVTSVNWSQFTTSATYTAGTGLTLTGFQFSITNTGVAASTYGSATATPVFAVNAQGQITSVTNTTITPAIGSVTGLATGMLTFLQTPTSANLAATVTDETGSGALVFNTSPTFITPALGTPASGVLTNATGLPLTTGVTGTLAIGNGGTGQTTASSAFNALSPITTTGDLIYGSGANTSSRLAIGSTNQVLTVVGGVPTWVTPAAGGVTTFSAGTTGFTPSTATTGAVTLSGTLNIANGGTGITSFGTGVQTALGQNVTGSGGIALATSPSFTTPSLGVATGTSLQVTSGLYSTSSYGGSFTDGIVVDYITGTGRFSVGTADGFAWYNGGVANTSIMTLSSSGVLATTSFSGAGTGLTGTASSLSIGGNAATATTATAATTATNATNTAITDNTSSSATWYPTIVSTTTGNLPQTTSSTKLSFVPSTGTFTSTVLSSTNDASISGLTVGKGGGSSIYNTVVGLSGLSSASNTGTFQTAIGWSALLVNTTGTANTALGAATLYANTTGSNNLAVGSASVGNSPLQANTTGSFNTAIGNNALGANTTASNNTAVGYQAGYSQTSAGYGTFVGVKAGYSSTGVHNTCIGMYSGYNLTTGTGNTFVGNFTGNGAGGSVTTGSKNTIIGAYDGNSGGLDIRTASNYIVLSDGDGNPQGYFNTSSNGVQFHSNANTGFRYTGYEFDIAGVYKSQIYWDNTNTNLYVQNASGGVYLTNTGTSWTSNSDERLKENLVDITDGLNKVCSLRSVIGNFIADETKKPTPFLIAQDVQKVLPEAVTTSTLKNDPTEIEYLGVAYTETIPLLVAAIKELNAKVTALETQLGAKA